MKRLSFFSSVFFLFVFSVFSQPKATPAQDIEKSLIELEKAASTSIVKQLPFENIGPSVMSGRVVDLAVNPDNPTEFYVGYASGGVWHTTNNGTTFTPIMDNSPTQNVGVLAVHWPTRTIWVGTGENNSSRSSYAGIGLLKSSDNGKTWQNMGLPDSHHIGKIAINSANPNEVVVGVTGHLYSPNKERGIYKTSDGGNTWQQTLFIDETTGIIDLQFNPKNFNVMYAAAWTKDRKAWNFDGSGNNSAIYKSTDAGATWTKISVEKSGFPTGDGVGRIGLAVYNDDILYAIHDNQFRRPKSSEKSKSTGLQKDDFKNMSKDAFLKLDDKELNNFLKANGFQEKYRAENVKNLVRNDNVKPADLATYLEDANSLLFDTEVIGTEIYKSTDGGQTWAKTHKDYLDGVYYSYGYYFGHIYVSPANQDHIYFYGVPILKSKDGGKTFKSMDAENVHVDHHSLWINPQNPNHLINGNDGGVNITYDDGNNWIKNNSTSVGQYYYINVDNQEPYNVYGGLQDNGVWVGPHNARNDFRWHQSGDYPWKSIMGGDGMQVQIDNRNPNIVYTGFQFGNYFRIDREKGSQTYIQPKHELGESPYRFNWQTPILLSAHNQDILYYGGNKLMRSMDQGNNWQAISPDLTKGGKKGNVAYGTLTTISESPFEFGLIYTGSDDGLIYITKNSGASWDNISKNLPQDLWVSRVVASQHKKERVYAALNGYRWDNFEVYIYVSEDYGNTWKSITNGIALSPVNVIKEDPENENILYAGTDNAAYVSFDKGENWHMFSEGLPKVAIHDLVIQPKAKHLLLGTHGRSIYKADISNLQSFKADMLTTSTTVFNLDEVRFSPRWGSQRSSWSDAFEPNIQVSFFSNSEETKTITILNEQNEVLFTQKFDSQKGYNVWNYNLKVDNEAVKKLKDNNVHTGANGGLYLNKGTYIVKIGDSRTTITIK
ncbi:glycosyl hydrolase [Paucihalobacter ruber]|uniref:Glycosyl hydrolase n=1 Tax=Paucihalobacter ruber TaxID=2567861 RepID=A0A506PM54_9FLAO|nr:glycosyl hydrolase [Paucihalobacter ruber]TPV34801.1 glycosyl hydrolase [Paucihalobacter ruber]